LKTTGCSLDVAQRNPGFCALFGRLPPHFAALHTGYA
jgi:hypothetical protein